MADNRNVTEEISLVRKRLDSLAKSRLLLPLDPELERAYRELCTRERELLDAKLTTP